MTPSDMLSGFNALSWNTSTNSVGVEHVPLTGDKNVSSPIRLKIGKHRLHSEGVSPHFAYDSDRVQYYTITIDLGRSTDDGEFDFAETKQLAELDALMQSKAEEAGVEYKPLLNSSSFHGVTAYSLTARIYYKSGVSRREHRMKFKCYTSKSKRVEITNQNADTMMPEDSSVSMLIQPKWFQANSFKGYAVLDQLKLYSTATVEEGCLL